MCYDLFFWGDDLMHLSFMKNPFHFNKQMDSQFDAAH
jgi:hypothetical protein